jgi:KUP system potassium uptake protein
MAINPNCAIRFLAHSGRIGFFILGGVFLAVTGGEALYADIGRVGRNLIRTTWYMMVLPSLESSVWGSDRLV